MTKTSGKMRTVRINDRGQLVIPEDIRRDLQIEGDTVLVLVEREGEIILRREADVLRDLDGVWKALRGRALERAWDDEDEVWEAHRGEGSA
jgi:AbrB family looped-hinge helix DNA binding protein